MLKLNRFILIVKLVASFLLLLSGFLEATYNPGPLDLLNGITSGFVLYGLWRTHWIKQ